MNPLGPVELLPSSSHQLQGRNRLGRSGVCNELHRLAIAPAAGQARCHDAACRERAPMKNPSVVTSHLTPLRAVPTPRSPVMSSELHRGRQTPCPLPHGPQVGADMCA